MSVGGVLVAMHGDDIPEHRPDWLENVPTAADLEYQAADLYRTQHNGLVELGQGHPTESNEAYIRVDTDTIIFDLRMWC
jgi:hypothetical protein